MSELYICVECEVSSDISEPTTLTQHGLCPRCGSSSVVNADTLVSMLSKKLAREQAAPSVDKNHAKRVEAMRLRRRQDVEPLVAHLKQRFPLTVGLAALDNSQLHKALDEWDGWAYHVYYPWTLRVDVADNPYPGHLVLELIQGVKCGPRWFILLDTYLAEVKRS